MTVAMQFTAIDMAQGVLARVKNSILGLGDAAGKVKRDFDVMTNNIASGLKAIAVASYAMQKALPGVKAAGDLEEAMLGVKMNIASSAKDARELTNMLSQVKGTAISVSADAPFSAEDVVRIQNSLLKAGMDLKDVVGKSGAAFAATALASLSGEAPEIIGDSLANIGTMFKFKGEDYSMFSDWATRVDDAAATSLPALIQGLRMSGSSAAALGISAKDSMTALGALSPLGERAGSSYNNFLLAFATRGKELRAMGLDMFKDGKFIGMAAATDKLKEKFGQIEDVEKRLNILTKIFGEEGGRAANTFINAEKGFKDIEKSAQGALSMAQKMSIWGEGMNASLKKLGGTAKSTLATIFDPLLAPITKVLNLLNMATGKLGEFAEKNKAIAVGMSGTVGAVALGAGAYGAYKLLHGGLAGARVMKGAGGLKGLIGGMGSTAAGVAQGKAVEAATGVMPVFVTNWPAGGMPVAPSVPLPGGGSAGKGMLDTIKGLFTRGSGGLLGAGKGLAALKTGATIATAGLGTSALLAGGAGLAGFGVGTLINKGIGAVTGGGEGWLGDMLYDLLHRESPTEKEVKNDIKLNINIDKNGRVITESNNPGTNLNISLARGAF
jgi:TP901 family phage tail tape measure protein